MEAIRKYEPLWGAWYVDGSALGEGSFGKVYKVKREEFGNTYYAAVKMLTIPQSEAQLQSVRDELLDEASARSYFEAMVTDIIQEVSMMNEFKGISNIVSIEDYTVQEKKDSIGWDIFIRMELLTTLSKYVHEKPLTTDEIIKVGLDISHALELCAVKNIIHRDIKPANIFVSQYGDFKLGDFGIARHIERASSEMSKKGTPTYMAPEVYKNEEYGASVDLYSLGLVMYRYLNHNRMPFTPPFPSFVSEKDKESSRKRRVDGEPIPDIPDIDPALNAFVLKACAYKPEDRFKSAEEFRRELEKIAGIQSSSPSVREIKPEPVERKGKKKRAMRQEDDGHTMGVFQVKHGEVQQEVPELAAPEVPASVLNVLALGGAACSALLAVLSLFSGNISDALLYLPVYALAAVMCFLKFRYKVLNIAFTAALALYLALTALNNISAFDYPLLCLVLGLLVSMPKSVKSRRILGAVLGVLALGTAAMIFRSSGGSDSQAFQEFIAASYGVPLLLLIACVLAVAGHVPAGMAALQLFALAAFVMFRVCVMFGGGSNVMMNIANASLVGFSPDKFSWWRYGRFAGLVLQTLAGEFAVLLACAVVVPDTFLDMLGSRKKAVAVLGACLAAIVAGIAAISFTV